MIRAKLVTVITATLNARQFKLNSVDSAAIEKTIDNMNVADNKCENR